MKLIFEAQIVKTEEIHFGYNLLSGSVPDGFYQNVNPDFPGIVIVSRRDTTKYFDQNFGAISDFDPIFARDEFYRVTGKLTISAE